MKHLQVEMKRVIDTRVVTGVAMAVEVNGNSWQGVIGFADAAGTRSLASDALFLIYSLTKTFTAVLVLKLCQRRLLDLDHTLSRWFPHVPASEQITIRHLLNHTSGLPDYGALPAYQQAVRESPGQPWPWSEFRQRTYEKELRFDPGQGWAYSNIGYTLLKRITESVTDRRFGRLLHDEIFAPLGMERSFVPQGVDDLEPPPDTLEEKNP